MLAVRKFSLFFVPLLLSLSLGCGDDDGTKPVAQTMFTLRIENISGTAGFSRDAADLGAVPFAPGVWAVADRGRILFREGEPDLGSGLEALAEDGDPATLAAALSSGTGIASSGVFNTPVGQSAPGPIGPGDAYEFTFEAEPGDYLSFASMYVQSNDLFVGPDGMGIDLFDEGDEPVEGDITSLISLWDAGTEINEEPGVGPNQAPRQAGPDTGPSEGVVQPVADGWTYPTNEEVLSVTVSSQPSDPGFTFTVRIEVRQESTTPLAPGIWAVHTAAGPVFRSGEHDFGMGLEALAEDGDPSVLGGNIASQMGVVSSGIFNTPVGATEPGPIGPGEAYEFTFDAEDGSLLSFATMFVQSNDLFYAPGDGGIALFTSPGVPIEGDITDQLLLWDAGTEINEEPGVGIHQPPRQSGPNTGPTEGIVQEVDDGYSYGPVDQLVRIELTTQ